MAVKKIQRCTRAPPQKSIQQILRNTQQQKHVTFFKKKNGKAMIIAQEIKFARLLSSNDKKVQDKVLKNLRKWLTVRSNSSFAFTESDFMRLWKGLFYCMWMSDKPLIQEELAESLSKIVHCFNSKDVALLYTMCVLKTLAAEWFGIDQYRLDKFSMLARRVIRQTFQKCKEKSWNIEWVKGVSEILEKLLIDQKTCIGFSMYLTEVFLEELAKISGGHISEDIVTELIKPFITYFIIMDDERQIRHVMRHIFRYLIFQSDIGLDYTEKFQAWRDAGFPFGSIDAMERIEVSDEEIEDNDIGEEKYLKKKMESNVEKPLDPRAGRVDVELPQIPFNANEIVTLLTEYKFHPLSTTKSRRQLRRLIKEFTELLQGNMPLGVKEIRIPKTKKRSTNTKLATMRFLEFEKELYSDKVEKKRKRKQNGQLVENENNQLSEEGQNLESINESSKTEEVDEIKTIKKKKQVQHEIDTNDNLTQVNSQALNPSTLGSKRKRYKIKGRKHSSCNIDVKNSNCEFKKNLALVIKNSADCDMKLRKKQTIATNILNIITPVKRKKANKLKICGKWDVSDNVISSMCPSLDNKNTELHGKIAEKTITENINQENNSLNEKPTWLVPVLRKLQNEKSKTSIGLKEQHKIITNSNSKKRVKIALQRNTTQHTSEYILQVRKSPSIPFDANRKPLAGVLKASPIPSPINPFYKKKH